MVNCEIKKNLYSNKDINILAIVLVAISLFLIGFASYSGYQSYFYTLLWFFVINQFCDNESRRNNYIYFHFFLILAICLYFIQKAQFPNYMGLSGPYGTDDLNYYAGLDARVTYPIPFINLLYLPKIIDSIDIIIFNILGIAFIPYLTNKTSYAFLCDKKAAHLAERLILFCPFMMSIGLVIMRDVLCASFVLAAFQCFKNKRFVYFVLFAGILLYLKLGYLVFLCIIISGYLYTHERLVSRSKASTFLKISIAATILLIVFFVYILPNLAIITGGRLTSESLFRESFIDYLQGNNDNSTLVRIYDLPLLIRLPALIIAFLVLPPLSPNFIFEGHFSVGAFMQNFVTPVYWFFIYIYFFDFCFSFKNLSIRAKGLFYVVLVLALALGMISLQARHKVVLMPFIYMIISYAMKNNLTKYRFLSVPSILLFVIAQIAFFYSRY